MLISEELGVMMKTKTKITTLSKVDSLIRYKIESNLGKLKDKTFSLTIYGLPVYSPKIASNNLIILSEKNYVSFMPHLAVGMGTGNLGLPAISPGETTIKVHFNYEFLEEMSRQDIIVLHDKLSSTLDSISENLAKNINFMDTL